MFSRFINVSVNVEISSEKRIEWADKPGLFLEAPFTLLDGSVLFPSLPRRLSTSHARFTRQRYFLVIKS